MNAKATEIASQITVGTRLGMVGREDIPVGTVTRITEKSIFFSDGTNASKRSLHRFYIAK